MTQFDRQEKPTFSSLETDQNLEMGMTVQFDTYSMSSLSGIWKALKSASDGSFFQSWVWIEHWLASSDHPRCVILVRFDQAIVGLGVLTINSAQRPLAGQMPIFSIHENGSDDEDRLAVEYNGLLCRTGYEKAVHKSVAQALMRDFKVGTEYQNWMEIRWPGCQEPVLEGIAESENIYRLYQSKTAPFVDLLLVRAENTTIGILYNFVYRDTVYAYQSGFIASQDNRIKPGLVSHTLAIHYYKKRGLKNYRFLAGNDRYKKSRATDSDNLYWIAMQKPDVQMRVENFLRGIKALLKPGRSK